MIAWVGCSCPVALARRTPSSQSLRGPDRPVSTGLTAITCFLASRSARIRAQATQVLPTPAPVPVMRTLMNGDYIAALVRSKS
jgi:hypothetical protein